MVKLSSNEDVAEWLRIYNSQALAIAVNLDAEIGDRLPIFYSGPAKPV
jgi:hypothetical protein